MSTHVDVLPERAEAEQYATILERLNRRVEHMTEAAVAFAPSRQYNDLTIIPVARVRSGFGGGFGTGKRAEQGEVPEGVGSGGATSVTPVGYIEVKEGATTFRPIIAPDAIMRIQIVGGLFALLLAALFSGRMAIRRQERKRGFVLSMLFRPGTRLYAGKRPALRLQRRLRARHFRRWGESSPADLRRRFSSLLRGRRVLQH